MDSSILMLMLTVSLFLGVCVLFGVIWGVKNRQFDDYRKFLDGAHFDDEDALNDAYELERRKKEALERKNKFES
ncbi:cbb3-type cytochrome oxidase assembly protein CcoS [Campylobacter sp. 9BO]|uniref:cbb3-type cytochrome oxidase assembly protein CcoS n=1 Tax=Campylobacter sp. 9BO TaxID=3424759 RepID=UPI003D334F7D